jgi:hypothetical protein
LIQNKHKYSQSKGCTSFSQSVGQIEKSKEKEALEMRAIGIVNLGGGWVIKKAVRPAK